MHRHRLQYVVFLHRNTASSPSSGRSLESSLFIDVSGLERVVPNDRKWGSEQSQEKPAKS
ncbi:hypothetical protein ZHAS_00007213 [Anopheles sinensis]|uniref:Uncharacterized protein n=1 Tax=Anopheles sinensis TaxID=74873 RepID=A0A084VPE8_ANOSI|nr:hypothetical protein ZHAS_00007213 [Anopheles sinensis]